MRNHISSGFILLLISLLSLFMLSSWAAAQEEIVPTTLATSSSRIVDQDGQISFGDINIPSLSSQISRLPGQLTHSVDTTTITPLNSIGCMYTPANYNDENHFYRVFDLDALGIIGDVTVESIDIGIESAVSNGGTQPVRIRLFTSSINPPDNFSLTLLSDTLFSLADASLTVRNFDVTDTVVPSGSILVVEILIPNAFYTHHTLFIGSNNLGQTDESYIIAPNCQIYFIKPLSHLKPDMHIVMVVNADGEFPPTSTPTVETTTATATDIATGTTTPTSSATCACFTPMPTNTPLETPIATATPTELVTQRELLVNGGFENDLAPWVLWNPTGDKVKCNTETKVIANSGECAFQFKGVVGKNSKIQQKVALDGLTFTQLDGIDLSMFYDARYAIVNGKVQVVVKYSDGKNDTKIIEELPFTTAYTELTAREILQSGAVRKIKIQVNSDIYGSKMYVDDVSLIHTTGIPVLLPLP